jgi:uncharacterized protein (UPF0332 family)
MLDSLISRLKKEGKLIEQKVGIVQIEDLLKEAIIDLDESKKTLHASADRATYLMAYMAMLKAGRALLFLKGYRPSDGAQHKTVVEMTGVILGDKYVNLVNHFETMRRKRNELTYEAGGLLSRSEAESALEDAKALVKKILEEAKSRNPQMELDF